MFSFKIRNSFKWRSSVQLKSAKPIVVFRRIERCPHCKNRIRLGHFFENLKSQHCLNLITEENARVPASMLSNPNSMSWEICEAQINAGDGHYDKAITHEWLIKGKRQMVELFHMQVLRNRVLARLSSARKEAKRKNWA